MKDLTSLAFFILPTLICVITSHHPCNSQFYIIIYLMLSYNNKLQFNYLIIGVSDSQQLPAYPRASDGDAIITLVQLDVIPEFTHP